jgi:hypothetical protein
MPNGVRKQRNTAHAAAEREKQRQHYQSQADRKIADAKGQWEIERKELGEAKGQLAARCLKLDDQIHVLTKKLKNAPEKAEVVALKKQIAKLEGQIAKYAAGAEIHPDRLTNCALCHRGLETRTLPNGTTIQLGNSAAPVCQAGMLCCDACNDRVIIPFRIMTGATPSQHKTDAENWQKRAEKAEKQIQDLKDLLNLTHSPELDACAQFMEQEPEVASAVSSSVFNIIQENRAAAARNAPSNQ